MLLVKKVLNLKSSLRFVVYLSVDALFSPLESLENSLVYKKQS